jgi:putative hydrolase of the HAD superfamily
MQNNRITTLVFDWGNTIMVDDPHFSGKMKDWPSVQTIDGVYQTIQTLSKEFEIILATNAEDSVKEDVRQALKRVHLDSFFTRIFTFHDVGYKKPNLEFYYQIQRTLDVSANEVIMVGDDYQNDILGAKLAGWKTIWFNPERKTASAHLPFQDGEIRTFDEILKIVKQPFLPDIQTCTNWYMELGATHTLLSHVNNVAAIAYQISIWMERKGYSVNSLLTHRGGLTHDLAKLQHQNQKNHAELAADFLMTKVQIDLADIARRHLIGDLSSDENRPQTWEQKIVNYADKLSEGSSVVSLDDRLLALQNRYPDFAEKIRINTPFVKSLEHEILSALDLSPKEFLSRLKSAIYDGD